MAAAQTSYPASIANFKPTHREVLGGIAPHLFEERRRKRSRRTSDRGSGSSPLRVSAVLTSWDENGVFMGQTEREIEVDETVEPTACTTSDHDPTRIEIARTLQIPRKDKSRWRKLQALKTIVIKLKSSAKSNL